MTKVNQNDKVKQLRNTKLNQAKKSNRSASIKTDQSEIIPPEDKTISKTDTQKPKTRRKPKPKVITKIDESVDKNVSANKLKDENSSSGTEGKNKVEIKSQISDEVSTKRALEGSDSSDNKPKPSINKTSSPNVEAEPTGNIVTSSEAISETARKNEDSKVKPKTRRRATTKSKEVRPKKNASTVINADNNLNKKEVAEQTKESVKLDNASKIQEKKEATVPEDIKTASKSQVKDTSQSSAEIDKVNPSSKEKSKNRRWSKNKSKKFVDKRIESSSADNPKAGAVSNKETTKNDASTDIPQAKVNNNREKQEPKEEQNKASKNIQNADKSNTKKQKSNQQKNSKAKGKVHTVQSHNVPAKLDEKSTNVNQSEKPLAHNITKPKTEPKPVPVVKTKPVEKFIPKVDLINLEFKNDEFIRTFLEKVEKFLRNEIYIASDFKIVCAVSGGVDSISLLDAISLIAQKIRFSVYVIHFNHKLRGESAERDEEEVAKIAKKYELPFYRASGDVKQYAERNKISIEHAARTLRYNFYERISRSVNADFLATAHNADDSAETFLINLLRGSGLTGLRGIPPKRNLVKNVLLVRPFHNIRKSDIIEYAKRRGLNWRTDETNYLIEYTRNKVRLELMPFIEREFSTAAVPLFNRTAKLIAGADDIIEELVTSHLINLVTNISNDSFSLKLNVLDIHSRFLQGELIQAALKKYFRMLPQSMSTIDRLLALKDSDVGAIVNLSGNFFALKEREYITFAKKTVAFDFHRLIDKESETQVGKYKLILSKTKDKPLNFPKNNDIEYLDYDKLPSILEIRSWQDGDSFKPLGMSGTMNISDFLTNNKVDHIERNNILVLTNMKEIVWVVGMRINDDYKITEATKQFLKLEFIRT